jgi:lipoyl(octanoyl) transferase
MNYVDFIYSKGSVDYDFALRYMKKRVDGIIRGIENQSIWLLEHPSIYTAGRSANDDEILKKINVPYYYTDRGGKFTYHGPGQRVIYVMLDLNQIFLGQPDLRIFIKKLGNWMTNALKKHNIVARLDKKNIGLWVGDKYFKRKIASIGVKMRKWVSYHGIAINIDTDMRYFEHIIPCGISEHKMTSIKLEKNLQCTCEMLDQDLKDEFFKEFDCILGREEDV